MDAGHCITVWLELHGFVNSRAPEPASLAIPLSVSVSKAFIGVQDCALCVLQTPGIVCVTVNNPPYLLLHCPHQHSQTVRHCYCTPYALLRKKDCGIQAFQVAISCAFMHTVISMIRVMLYIVQVQTRCSPSAVVFFQVNSVQ